MRCPDCSKMVSYDEPQATVEDEGINEDGLSIEIRLVLPCAECGAELKETTFSFEHELEHMCEEGKILCGCGHPKPEHHNVNGDSCPCNHHMGESKDEEHLPCNCPKFIPTNEEGFELQVDDQWPTEDFKPKTITNRKGEEKPVPMRYQKHFYGVQVSGTATCNKCGEEIQFELSDEIQSSGMDELV